MAFIAGKSKQTLRKAMSQLTVRMNRCPTRWARQRAALSARMEIKPRDFFEILKAAVSKALVPPLHNAHASGRR